MPQAMSKKLQQKTKKFKKNPTCPRMHKKKH
jgi:hypothetical protein